MARRIRSFTLLQLLWSYAHTIVEPHKMPSIPRVKELDALRFLFMVIDIMPLYLSQFHDSNPEPYGSILIRYSLGRRFHPFVSSTFPMYDRWLEYIPRRLPHNATECLPWSIEPLSVDVVKQRPPTVPNINASSSPHFSVNTTLDSDASTIAHTEHDNNLGTQAGHTCLLVEPGDPPNYMESGNSTVPDEYTFTPGVSPVGPFYATAFPRRSPLRPASISMQVQVEITYLQRAAKVSQEIDMFTALSLARQNRVHRDAECDPASEDPLPFQDLYEEFLSRDFTLDLVGTEHEVEYGLSDEVDAIPPRIRHNFPVIEKHFKRYGHPLSPAQAYARLPQRDN